MLLNAIKKAIDNGHIETWSYDSDGDFTHNVDQWKNKAWLRPQIYSDALELVLVSPHATPLVPIVRGVYLGRFSEMLIAHFDQSISSISILK